MLTEICQYLRNFFERDKWHDAFKVAGGVLTYADGAALPLMDGQYYRIIGSVFNDGVHKWGDVEDALIDEPKFTGSVWPMAVPPDLINLADEIKAWNEKYGGVDSTNMSPFSSESFGGYSYNKAQGFAATGGGMLTSWQSLYAARLAPWRKI